MVLRASSVAEKHHQVEVSAVSPKLVSRALDSDIESKVK